MQGMAKRLGEHVAPVHSGILTAMLQTGSQRWLLHAMGNADVCYSRSTLCLAIHVLKCTSISVFDITASNHAVGNGAFHLRIHFVDLYHSDNGRKSIKYHLGLLISSTKRSFFYVIILDSR